MNCQKLPKLTGVALALAAAGLVGCASSNGGSSASASGAETIELVHCYGVNKCKGYNDCGTDANACAGKGACKGQGFVALPESSCDHIGGSVKDDAKVAVSSADLVHCYGVNKCKGHNDCGTDANACGGKGACKGQGFVAAPEKSCAEIGGEVGA